MKIQNLGMANTNLVIGGEVVTGDAEGVFDIKDKAAKELLTTPGWHDPLEEAVQPALPEEPEAKVEAPQEPAEAPEPEAAPEPEEAPVEAPVEEEAAPEPAPEPPKSSKKKKRRPA